MLIHDMSNLNDQIIKNKIQIIKDKLASVDQNKKVSFNFLKIDIIDPFFSTIVRGSFEFVLSMRRNFLKSVKKNEIKRIIENLLNCLQSSDMRVFELYK
jgi:hypothetical protein